MNSGPKIQHGNSLGEGTTILPTLWQAVTVAAIESPHILGYSIYSSDFLPTAAGIANTQVPQIQVNLLFYSVL